MIGMNDDDEELLCYRGFSLREKKKMLHFHSATKIMLGPFSASPIYYLY